MPHLFDDHPDWPVASESKTPRTDAVMAEVPRYWNNGWMAPVVALCRELETALSDRTQELATAMQRIEGLQRTVESNITQREHWEREAERFGEYAGTLEREIETAYGICDSPVECETYLRGCVMRIIGRRGPESENEKGPLDRLAETSRELEAAGFTGDRSETSQSNVSGIANE